MNIFILVNVDSKDLQDKKCKLSGVEILELDDLAQLTHLYVNHLLSEN